jgi:hypothetical protein
LPQNCRGRWQHRAAAKHLTSTREVKSGRHFVWRSSDAPPATPQPEPAPARYPGSLSATQERAERELKALARASAEDPWPSQHYQPEEYRERVQRESERRQRRRHWEAILP